MFIDDVFKYGSMVVIDNVDFLIIYLVIEVIIEVMGDFGVGICFVMKVIENGKYIVMVNVEVDVVVGFILVWKVRQVGVVYLLVWGDQLVLIVDYVDWVCVVGFKVVVVGKGM